MANPPVTVTLTAKQAIVAMLALDEYAADLAANGLKQHANVALRAKLTLKAAHRLTVRT